MSAFNWYIRAAEKPKLTLPPASSATFPQAVANVLGAILRNNGIDDVGTIKGSVDEYPTTGWLRCDGAAVSRVQFPALFAKIGATFGAGDGSTTFNVPDYTATAPVADPAPPETVIQGGSVVPASGGVPVPAPVPDGQVGGTAYNTPTGGRPRSVRTPQGLENIE